MIFYHTFTYKKIEVLFEVSSTISLKSISEPSSKPEVPVTNNEPNVNHSSNPETNTTTNYLKESNTTTSPHVPSETKDNQHKQEIENNESTTKTTSTTTENIINDQIKSTSSSDPNAGESGNKRKLESTELENEKKKAKVDIANCKIVGLLEIFCDKKKQLEKDFEETFLCGICQEILYKVVTLIPW